MEVRTPHPTSWYGSYWGGWVPGGRADCPPGLHAWEGPPAGCPCYLKAGHPCRQHILPLPGRAYGLGVRPQQYSCLVLPPSPAWSRAPRGLTRSLRSSWGRALREEAAGCRGPMAGSCTRLPFGEAVFWGSCARWLGASVARTTPGRRRGPERAASTGPRLLL